MRSYLLGIDVGTTGAKAILIDEHGSVLAEALSEYPMSSPRPLWAEQNPEDWWNGCVASIRQVLVRGGASAKQVAGIGLTGQMHGLVMLDAKGEVLRPCIMWNDQRTGAECAEITSLVGEKRLLAMTGNPVLPGFTAPKVAWVRKNEPEVFARTARILLPKDYVRYRLTGTFCTDVSDASGMSLFDVGRRRWSSEMLDALRIPLAWVADVAESPSVTSHVHRSAAASADLLEGTPVVAGAGDQAAQAVGTGIVREGAVSVTLGTSGVVFAASDTYRIEPEGRLHAFCHAVPGMWHLMGVMLSAGGSFRWYRDTLCGAEQEAAARRGVDAYELLTDEARRVPAGAEGLLFLPYLTGERTPYPNPHARGVFFGLTIRHTKAHMTRSVMEGVTFGLRDSMELLHDLGIRAREVRASGGGARSELWRQIMADVFGTTIHTVNVTQGAAFGAALLAGVGSGVHASVAEAASKAVTVAGQASPSRAAAAYERAYRRYRALYPALVREFDAAAQTEHEENAGI